MKRPHKHIAILCDLDNYATSVRPMEISKYLSERGHRVTIINKSKIFYGGSYINSKSSGALLKLLFEFIDEHLTGWPYYYYLLLKLKLRLLAIEKLVKNNDFDVLMCENSIQAYAVKDINCITILDLDSPYTDELYYTGKLFLSQRDKINNIFKKIYKKADFVNFHWFRYTDYVKENIYNGNNIVEINYGCTPKSKSLLAKFSPNPRIICLGYLGGKWVNLPLLSRLSKIYPIDVYGGPAPNSKWELTYKGYAPTTELLKTYQFGLVTISDDKLRRSSFSSKHLEYLSFGLPVLTPVWRQDRILKEVSLYYDESNFIDVIKKYTEKKQWESMSKKCYEKSLSLQWNKVLEPLGNIISKLA